MKALGKILTALSLVLLALAAANSQAAITASLDRDRVAMGDSLRLTINATNDEDLAEIDLRPLVADFEILQRSSNSSTSWINGQRTDSRQLLVEITPRREGSLQIPPLRLGQAATNGLRVTVGPAPTGAGGNDTVLFEADLDQDTVFVQGQVILTLRLQQAINLDERSITEFKLDHAFVRPLEQKSFQRTVDGRPWLVHEVRYAIFPEQSGTLEIPAQTFSGREMTQRRSVFDVGAGGRLLRRTTRPLSIKVLPRADAFPDGTWLPARNLTVEETWSTAPEQLRAGESSTRTIRIRAEGLQGAQLPPALFPATEGLKYYPDQPVITDTEITSGLVGAREDSAALVPTRAGRWKIPEVRIPWWDIDAGKLRYAVLPAREIAVAAADTAAAGAPGGLTIPAPTAAPVDMVNTTVPAPQVQASGTFKYWQLLAVINGIGWLLTLGYLLRSGRKPAAPDTAKHDKQRPKFIYQQLLKSCAQGHANQARQHLIEWAAATFPNSMVVSLSQVSALFDNAALEHELTALNAALYGDADQQWNGSALAECVSGLHRQRQQREANPQPPLELYPQAV